MYYVRTYCVTTILPGIKAHFQLAIQIFQIFDTQIINFFTLQLSEIVITVELWIKCIGFYRCKKVMRHVFYFMTHKHHYMLCCIICSLACANRDALTNVILCSPLLMNGDSLNEFFFLLKLLQCSSETKCYLECGTNKDTQNDMDTTQCSNAELFQILRTQHVGDTSENMFYCLIFPQGHNYKCASYIEEE